jgi:plastocyanin
MDRRAFLAGSAALLGGCVGRGAEDDHDVGMTLQAFDPATITVSTGTEVVWKNTSSRGHTVSAYDDGIPEAADYFASGGYDDEDAAREAFNNSGGGVIDGSGTYSHTFEVPGVYEYVCIPHERGGMVGTVNVEE